MAYLPKATVDRSIKVRVRKSKKGYEHTDFEAYLGVDPFSGKAMRITRKDKKELKRDIADFYARHRYGGDAAVRLTAMQALDAKNAFDALAAANLKVSLYDVANAYIISLTEETEPESTKKVAEAFDEYFIAKYALVESDDKAKTNATTGRWVRTLGEATLSDVTAKSISDYLSENFAEKKPKTYNSHLEYIKRFLNWCCKEPQEYLSKSPARQLEPRPEPWIEPKYMKPADVERLFRLLESMKDEHPEYLAQAVVGFFTGTRAIEIQRMATIEGAAKIHLEDETIRIAMGKGFQQGKMPRAFHIEPTAMAWMKSFDFLNALKKVDKNTVNDIYKLARINKIPVFQNCVRHTFITYHVAAYGDPVRTQAIVGTSAKYRAENYCGLASKADGEAYFKIWPSCFKPVEEQ